MIKPSITSNFNVWHSYADVIRNLTVQKLPGVPLTRYLYSPELSSISCFFCILHNFFTLFSLSWCYTRSKNQFAIYIISPFQVWQWFHNLVLKYSVSELNQRGLGAEAALSVVTLVLLYFPSRIVFFMSFLAIETFKILLNVSRQKFSSYFCLSVLLWLMGSETL